MGPVEERIIQQCLREGRDFPERIVNAPEIPLGLSIFLEAFYEVSTCRGGMGGPIPWTAVNEYGRRYNWTGEDFEDLVYHVRALDKVILDKEEEKSRSGPT